MFDYRFNRKGEEYVANLRQQAQNDRLVRSVKPSSLATATARVFRAWAARLEPSAGSPAEGQTTWTLDDGRYEAPGHGRPQRYVGFEL